MAPSTVMWDYAVELLESMGALARSMFGGFGLFRDSVMFGLIVDDVLHFKTGDANRGDYEAAGMGPFVFGRKGHLTIAMSYHEVPSGVLEDREEILARAPKALAVARAAKDDKPKRAKKTRSARKV
jgi:DNA transformation protein